MHIQPIEDKGPLKLQEKQGKKTCSDFRNVCCKRDKMMVLLHLMWFQALVCKVILLLQVELLVLPFLLRFQVWMVVLLLLLTFQI